MVGIPRPYNPFVSRPYDPLIDGPIDETDPRKRKQNRGLISSQMEPLTSDPKTGRPWPPTPPTIQQFGDRFNPPPMPTPAEDPAPGQSIGQKIKSGFNNFLGSDAALALAAGIAEGGTNSEAIGRGFGYALDARSKEDELATEAGKNAAKASATAAFLKNAGADPSLVKLAEQGYGADALKLYSAEKEGGDTIINTGNTDEDELRKKLSGKEGEHMATIIESGDMSENILQSMEVLDELGKVAPQGAIQGRLAEYFPGFSTAGDAFEAETKKLAPALRTPGSGSTSDVEYEGFLKGLPRLRNTTGGNKIISSILRAKAQVNLARRDLIFKYQDGDIELKELRDGLRKLSTVSIIPPEAKAVLQSEYGSSGGNVGGVDWEFE